jgi:hypothetical protein
MDWTADSEGGHLYTKIPARPPFIQSIVYEYLSLGLTMYTSVSLSLSLSLGGKGGIILLEAYSP